MVRVHRESRMEEAGPQDMCQLEPRRSVRVNFPRETVPQASHGLARCLWSRQRVPAHVLHSAAPTVRVRGVCRVCVVWQCQLGCYCAIIPVRCAAISAVARVRMHSFL